MSRASKTHKNSAHQQPRATSQNTRSQGTLQWSNCYETEGDCSEAAVAGFPKTLLQGTLVQAHLLPGNLLLCMHADHVPDAHNPADEHRLLAVY